jgi:hypothetical protein
MSKFQPSTMEVAPFIILFFCGLIMLFCGFYMHTLDVDNRKFDATPSATKAGEACLKNATAWDDLNINAEANPIDNRTIELDEIRAEAAGLHGVVAELSTKNLKLQSTVESQTALIAKLEDLISDRERNRLDGYVERIERATKTEAAQFALVSALESRLQAQAAAFEIRLQAQARDLQAAQLQLRQQKERYEVLARSHNSPRTTYTPPSSFSIASKAPYRQHQK